MIIKKKIKKEKIKKNDNIRMIDDLTKKLSVTKNKKKREKIKQKIQYLKQAKETPPPPPPKS